MGLRGSAQLIYATRPPRPPQKGNGMGGMGNKSCSQLFWRRWLSTAKLLRMLTCQLTGVSQLQRDQPLPCTKKHVCSYRGYHRRVRPTQKCCTPQCIWPYWPSVAFLEVIGCALPSPPAACSCFLRPGSCALRTCILELAAPRRHCSTRMLTCTLMQKDACSLPGSNWPPFACEANVITTTPRELNVKRVCIGRRYHLSYSTNKRKTPIFAPRTFRPPQLDGAPCAAGPCHAGRRHGKQPSVGWCAASKGLGWGPGGAYALGKAPRNTQSVQTCVRCRDIMPSLLFLEKAGRWGRRGCRQVARSEIATPKLGPHMWAGPTTRTAISQGSIQCSRSPHATGNQHSLRCTASPTLQLEKYPPCSCNPYPAQPTPCTAHTMQLRPSKLRNRYPYRVR